MNTEPLTTSVTFLKIHRITTVPIMNTGNSLAQKTSEGKYIRDHGAALPKAVVVEYLKEKK